MAVVSCLLCDTISEIFFFTFSPSCRIPLSIPADAGTGRGILDLLSGCVKSGRGAQRRCTGRLCAPRRSHRRRLWLPGRRCPEPRCTIIIEGPGLRNKGGICRKTTAEVGTVAQRRAALQRSCKICGAGLTNGSGRGKVMGGKGQSAFLRQKNEVVVMEPAGSSNSLYPRSVNQTAASLQAGKQPCCA